MKRRTLWVAVLIIGIALFGFSGCIPQALAQSVSNEQPLLMRLNCTKALKGNKEITVDPKTPSVAPFTLDGKTMLPVRFSENLGAEVNYDEKTMNTTVKFNGIELYLELDNPIMRKTINGQVGSVNLPTPSSMVEGKTYVPIREIAENLGFSVYYDGGTYVIVVSEKPLSNSELESQINTAAQELPSKILGIQAITAKNPSRSLNVGESVQLSVADITFSPENPGCIRLRYVSDNPRTATVTSQGKVVGKEDGTAVITIKSHNGKEGKFTFKVGSGTSMYTEIPDSRFPIPMRNGEVIPYDRYIPTDDETGSASRYVYYDTNVLELYKEQLKKAGFKDLGAVQSIDSFWMYDLGDGTSLAVNMWLGEDSCAISMYIVEAYQPVTSSESKEIDFEVISLEYRDNDCPKVKFTLPQLSGMKDTEKQKRLNDLIVADFINNFKTPYPHLVLSEYEGEITYEINELTASLLRISYYYDDYHFLDDPRARYYRYGYFEYDLLTEKLTFMSPL